MSEERLKSIELMMAELIRIVGNTNSAVEELRSEVAELRSRVDELTVGQARIESRLGRIEAEVYEIRESQKSLFEIVGEHDVAIRNLRRRPV